MGDTETECGEEPIPQISYRWSCPYCNSFRTSSGSTDEESVRDRAKSAVVGHVSSSDGDGHGPRHSLPDDFDPTQAVERIPSR